MKNHPEKIELIDIEGKSRAVLPEQILNFIDKCLRMEKPKSQLIAVLHEIQEYYGYLPKDKLAAVSQLMQIPEAKVAGVSSFYHYFHSEPRGKFIISICMGTACYVNGAETIVQKLEKELGIKFGETTRDGLFTLEVARCLGTCALAPVVKINNDVHAQVTPDQIPLILKTYIKKARAEKDN